MGIDRLSALTQRRSCFDVRKNMLVIEGNALRIASFDGAEITVRGDIAAVRWKVEEAEKHA